MKKLAIVQSPPVLLNLARTIEQVCDQIAESARNSADLVMFPEAYLPGYPSWVWRLKPGGDMGKSKDLHHRLFENSVDLGKDGLGRIQRAAKQSGITVAVGFHEINSEASGSTLYNSYAIICPEGNILNVHRKLIPTNPERMVWGWGDARGLNVVQTPAGKIGTLICWENYMPLSRYALYAQGVELYLAPTWDCGESWLGTLRHIAREGGCWVAGCSTAIQAKDIPEDVPHRNEVFPDPEDWLSNGDAVLYRPFGPEAAGPMNKEKGILYSEYDLGAVIDARRSMDIGGHYSRPDLFKLEINKSELNPISWIK
ncbi:MAG: carbon-nitrogen hydrolase family protein [Bdellovibrionaceae bacterium]|nr:carbon-nitrogen hydrolase family protein [Bdellovibrionales bacterium]MCB9085197.1 carbon-nitrogen hydrolase family protein [Pseudobdellovibrionaceae bacterium]